MSVSPSDAVNDTEDVEDVTEATSTQEASKGADSSGRLGSREGLQDALLSTEPQRPLSAVDSPWNPSEGGINRIYRGIQKMLDFSGTPAIIDVVIGAAEFVKSFNPDTPDSDDSGDADGEENDEIPAGIQNAMGDDAGV